MPKVSDRDSIMQILQDNAHLNFVQRIISPDSYPVLNHGDGTHSTHLMADSEVDGKGIAYPTIIHNPETKKLRWLGPDAAYEHAMQTGEYIQFDKPEDAGWFAENYKKAWELQ